MAKAPKSVSDAMKYLKENDVKYVDLRFTDPRGKMQHVTMDISTIDEDVFADGLMFDGSSIAGWKAINESDMVLMLDPASLHIDPFYAQKMQPCSATFSSRAPAKPMSATRAPRPRRPKPT
jgi:glutamine synthetase